jgi:hypothetical protein
MCGKKATSMKNITFEKKCFWAKKAMEIDTYTEKGEKEYSKLAKQSGLGPNQLAYYLNAYEAAGESGVKALVYNKKLPEELKLEATKKISAYLNDKFSSIPQQHKHKLGFAAEVQGNRITVYERRPVFSDPSRWCRSSVFQVRYTDYDKRWHLYWRRASGKWWPFVGEYQVHTIIDCIRQVELRKECFWG